MKVAFRADASLQIGTGHVMRCLTLADALREKGADCTFITRDHAGNLIDLVHSRGFSVSVLPATDTIGESNAATDDAPNIQDAEWLGCDWRTDAQQSDQILESLMPDWLVIDNYALDERWESVVNLHVGKVLIIDDLANRPHACDLLLDQNLGRKVTDYSGLVTKNCDVLTGPQYSLLRPEFAAWRDYSLQRRKNYELKRILITMGGVDQPNATGQVLEALKACSLPSDARITVVMGLHAQWLESVKEIAATMPWQTKVLVNITNMAQVMADSDLAIGAAGSTSWERCCLGLPALLVMLAENQCAGARALQNQGAAILLGDPSDIQQQLPLYLLQLLRHGVLSEMSRAACVLTSGQGAYRVVEHMGRHQ